jgi:prepilin-type processing-associated H-X9-DG protein
MRFNAAFFDGHVETLDGRTAMNPMLYVPKGAVVPKNEVATEAYNAFMSPASQMIAP